MMYSSRVGICRRRGFKLPRPPKKSGVIISLTATKPVFSPVVASGSICKFEAFSPESTRKQEQHHLQA